MNRKGVTPVVAITLLIGVTVAASGAIYTMVNNSMNAQQDPSERLEINPQSVEFESCWGTPDKANFSLRNTGSSAINASEIPVRVNNTYLEQSNGDYTLDKNIVDPQAMYTMSIDISEDLSKESRIALVIDGENIRYQCRNLN